MNQTDAYPQVVNGDRDAAGARFPLWAFFRFISQLHSNSQSETNCIPHPSRSVYLHAALYGAGICVAFDVGLRISTTRERSDASRCGLVGKRRSSTDGMLEAGSGLFSPSCTEVHPASVDVDVASKNVYPDLKRNVWLASLQRSRKISDVHAHHACRTCKNRATCMSKEGGRSKSFARGEPNTHAYEMQNFRSCIYVRACSEWGETVRGFCVLLTRV